MKLLLVGPFEQEQDPLPNNIINEIDKNTNIITVGFQKDVRPYFAISDVLVFPSYREGFPNVVLQAGAMELPSIVTNISGSNEIIENGKNGVIIPKKDSGALMEAMLELLNNHERRSRLKSNSRDLIVGRYQNAKVWEAVLSEYEKLLEENPKTTVRKKS